MTVSLTPVLPLFLSLHYSLKLPYSRCLFYSRTPYCLFTPVISSLYHSGTLSVSFTPDYLYVSICLCYDLINEECLNGKSIRSSVPPGTGIRLVHTIQGDRLIMAVCFCYLVKSDHATVQKRTLSHFKRYQNNADVVK